jgi:hypothetical protein
MQTVYEAAGGDEGLLRLASAWHARVLDDEVVNHAFSHGFHAQHCERLAAYWAEAQVRSFINSFDPKHQKLFRSVRTAVRKRFPTANELAYEYNHSVVIAYSPSDRGTESTVSIALRADGVSLYLMNGPQLPDPKGLLLGSGKQVRFVRVESARQLAHPDVEALIAAAIDRSSVPMLSKGRGKLILRGPAAKQQTRRTAA